MPDTSYDHDYENDYDDRDYEDDYDDHDFEDMIRKWRTDCQYSCDHNTFSDADDDFHTFDID